jgi:hypothetical protein
MASSFFLSASKSASTSRIRSPSDMPLSSSSFLRTQARSLIANVPSFVAGASLSPSSVSRDTSAIGGAFGGYRRAAALDVVDQRAAWACWWGRPRAFQFDGPTRPPLLAGPGGFSDAGNRLGGLSAPTRVRSHGDTAHLYPRSGYSSFRSTSFR